MSDIEDKIDEKLREKFGDSVEEAADSLGFGRMMRLGFLWFQICGVIMVLVASVFAIKDFDKLSHPTLELKIIDYEYKSGEKDPWYPVFEYKVGEKTYTKTNERGYWKKVFEIGEIRDGEYLEDLPESAVIGRINKGSGKGFEQLIIVGLLGLGMILFPFLIRKFIQKDREISK